MNEDFDEPTELILAAEEWDPDKFEQFHKFSKTDQAIISKLMTHGPVLLRGGRGSGKSALMIEASRRLWPINPNSTALGIYVSLRYLELIKAKEGAYQEFFCTLLLDKINEIRDTVHLDVDYSNIHPSVTSLRRALTEVSSLLNKRIVLFFDDAAHIGREASLEDFFDIFRTISSNTVSCKAAIYPGVTRFGTRFDVFNDTTVVDVSRSEELKDFGELFSEIMQVKFGKEFPNSVFTAAMSREDVASFIGQAVLGNMRAFVFACRELSTRLTGRTVGLPELTDTLTALSSNHIWPLLEELKPKLGVYEPMIQPAMEIAEILFTRCGKAPNSPRSVLIHRDIIERLAKPFEILEYVGFITRREVSRALKSGGRGARFSINLCTLLEKTPGSRLTRDLYDRWTTQRIDPLEFHQNGNDFRHIVLPQKDEQADIKILDEPIASLQKSNTYPYGLTERKISILQEANLSSVRQLADASDDTLLKIPRIGPHSLQRIRNVVGQAIWM